MTNKILQLHMRQEKRYTNYLILIIAISLLLLSLLAKAQACQKSSLYGYARNPAQKIIFKPTAK